MWLHVHDIVGNGFELMSLTSSSSTPLLVPLIFHFPCAMFVDFAAPLQDLFLRPRGLTQNSWWAAQERFFKIFWLRIVHFGLVWLWHMIRQFRIHLIFLQNFCVSSRPLQVLRPTRNYGCCGSQTRHCISLSLFTALCITGFIFLDKLYIYWLILLIRE